ncbi:hypothetical protein AVEN_69848-1 [Araneus ventricosus]|uniref:Uncharacterized protein n=1 Tax=Araneus ventricosus TaxID=182803 RepID=A0A4Y2KCJ5_ARAVE|nr:hypothetical protein AVEN_69848-1 [Araneus ventricosus]
MSHLDFRLQLVEELAKIYGESKHSSQNTTSSDRLNGRHFPSHIQPTQKKKAPTKICIVCSQKFNEKGQREIYSTSMYSKKVGRLEFIGAESKADPVADFDNMMPKEQNYFEAPSKKKPLFVTGLRRFKTVD